MAINIHIPESVLMKPVITVFGVGGAGGNAINNMVESQLDGVKFIAANTDAQALSGSLADKKVQLGADLTRGLGAGANPKIGASAAEEALAEIMPHIEDSNLVVVTAGMGGGTGTGAAPVIARIAKERGILTIGVVTKPFDFEGVHRMRLARQGIEELEKYVDTLIVIPNQNLFKIASANTTFAQAFKLADNVLYSGVRSITDLILKPGLVNLDFADIKTIMNEMGKAMMGTGEAEGEGRAIRAAEAAISNPLLDYSSMKGARGVLINITGGADMTLFEVDEAANRIRAEVENDNANIIFGSTFTDELKDKIRVSVVATGINAPNMNKKFAAFTQETPDLIVDESLQPEATLPPQEHKKKGVLGRIFSKMLGSEEQDLSQPKIEIIECEEVLGADVYKKPTLRRKEEDVSE
jgi:cell division protein FtsZ